MLSHQTPVALVSASQAEAEIFTQGLAEVGFRRVTAFTSATEAYEVASRQQFELFVTRMEMPDLTGVVLIQKLRATGNYGLEQHLFVCNRLDAPLLSLCAELDLAYILVPPLSRATVAQKFKHLVQTENNLSEVERKYRDAKSAFASDLIDMAEACIAGVLAAAPDLEKALILRGDIFAKRGLMDQANAQYKEALRVNPKSAVAVHKLAQVLMEQGDFIGSTLLLNKLADLSPYNIKLLENAGLANLNAEQYDQAKHYMTKLAVADEKSKAAASITAQVKIKTGDFSDLVGGLRRGMDEKEMVQFLNNAGAKLSSENDVDGALRMYQAVVDQIQANKYLYAIHFNMGLAYRKKQDYAKARQHFERSAKLNPEFAKATAALKELPPEAA